MVGCQISFPELMADADLEVYRLSFQQVDLPLCHPKTLVLCQSYATVDPSFVPKLLKIDATSRFLILMGVGRVMGMFLAFSPREIPSVVHRYMTSLEKLTLLVSNVLGFELPLLRKIVVNSWDRVRPSALFEGQARWCQKRRRVSAVEFGARDCSLGLLPRLPSNVSKGGPSNSV